MKILCLPSDQLFGYVMTGKFRAPSRSWKHQLAGLSDYELIVMTEGTLYISYNNENFTLRRGEYLLLPPGAMRQGFQPAYCAFYWLHFTTHTTDVPVFLTPSGVLPPTEAYFTIPQTGSIPKLEKIVILMKQLQDIVKNNYPAIALSSMSTSILTELFGQLASLLPAEELSTEQKQIYFDIIDYIKTNISRNIKISEIAAVFGYNEKYISHRFAQICGIPLKQYILKTKMDTASFMLTDTNKSISEIAREIGFSDSHNFSRAYKKLTGFSPSEYRDTFSKRLLYHV